MNKAHKARVLKSILLCIYAENKYIESMCKKWGNATHTPFQCGPKGRLSWWTPITKICLSWDPSKGNYHGIRMEYSDGSDIVATAL